jgi:predicted O-methyltransferase YrrM
MIPTLVIDSTYCSTELCAIGKAFGTDKSPYNERGHRHPYTPVYNMLFSQYKNKPIKFAEIGVAGGASVVMWNVYFQNASLYFFDKDQNFLNNAAQYVSPIKNKFEIMDVRDVSGMTLSFSKIDDLDILLDDSSHNIDDQNKIIHAALPYVKSGGMIIIEDIDRVIKNEDYYNIIKDIEHEFSFITFILTEHQNRYSPGYDNDKLLLLVKK